jgi:hypothetical protein
MLGTLCHYKNLLTNNKMSKKFLSVLNFFGLGDFFLFFILILNLWPKSIKILLHFYCAAYF